MKGVHCYVYVPFVQRGTVFVISCSFFWTKKSVHKGVCSKRKEFAYRGENLSFMSSLKGKVENG